MIIQVTYERVFNLGSYESERISAVASVEDGATDAAYAEARAAVEEQHARTLELRQEAQPSNGNGGATYAEPPASDKQRNYLANLQSRLGWSPDQLADYAAQESIDLSALTKGQASTLIDLLQHAPAERQPAVVHDEPPGVVGEYDLPF